MSGLIHTGLGSSSLVAHVLHSPPPPPANSFVIGPAVINTHISHSRSGATKAHDWMVSIMGPLFRTAGHTVHTQHGVTASAGCHILNYLRDQAGELTSALPTTGLGQAATCSKTVCSHTHRTSMARCLLMGNNTLTIRTFLFSQQLLVLAAACTASFCVLFFYRPTGRPRRTSLQLECHRKTTKRTRSDSSARLSSSH